MAAFANIPMAAAAPAGDDCLPCQTLRAALTECGTCPGAAAGQPASPTSLCPSGKMIDPNNPDACIPIPTPQNAAQQSALQKYINGQPLTAADQNALRQITQQRVCPAGEHPAPCAAGECSDPNTGCCKTAAVETCFVCPGGLPDFEAALAGQPNSCYIDSQHFFPCGGTLPSPMMVAS